MMRQGRLEGLTLRTHVEFFLTSLFFGRYRRPRNGAGIRQGRLGVTGQGEGDEEGIEHTQNDGDPAGACQKRDSESRVAH